MTDNLNRDPDLEWLYHVQRVGLVVAPNQLKKLGLLPLRQGPLETGAAEALIDPDISKPALRDPWAFAQQILGWPTRYVAGAPGGPDIPTELLVPLPEHATTLTPTWAVAELGEDGQTWQLLVRIESAGVDPDRRAALGGWEATPHQRFERLLRDTGVFAGVMITDDVLRLVYAPRGETSGHLTFPIRSFRTVAGRPMLGGLKLLLDRVSLFTGAVTHRLPVLLKESRDAQADVSSDLAEQVLGALHELLRGLDQADSGLVRELAKSRPDHLYEGLLAVLMRLVFVLYAEDRDLLPSLSGGRAKEIYETSYSVRGLYARLVQDAALNPDTMDERRGGWGRLLALFRLIHAGHNSGFVQARGGKLFNPDEFPFLDGRSNVEEPSRVLTVSDGCMLRILEGLMTLKVRGGGRERLSYRTLDVEQIGSVYETVMGFSVEPARSLALAIKAGKNNRTPVFVCLDELLALKGKDRIKDLKENSGRGALAAAQSKAVEAASSIEELAAALDNIVDERGSPRHGVAPTGSPILQPTNERRRTGSHYTPRTLTAPIVKYALEPAFTRIGPDATPEQVLALKVCDPAMGSGAFLVEACRVLGERLVAAWERWPETRPVIPADEDEDLHARRLVAQRCLYGVDKNPRAVDLARLSLWLATLARDHEFTFLDHALKCGDSLVGLTAAQISAATWNESKPALPLFRQLVKDRVSEALRGRAVIRDAPDDTLRAVQEARHNTLENRLAPIRAMGDAVISAFFAADKPKSREQKRVEVESWLSGSLQGQMEKLDAAVASLHRNEGSIQPFHWEVEFPEVFARETTGFDAIVGNPPFLGGSYITRSHGADYFSYLTQCYAGCIHHCDYVGYFLRRIFSLLKVGGVMGVIATKTISQGDTREGALVSILNNDGHIIRLRRSIVWPGEASVTVVVLHISRGDLRSEIVLDDRLVERISAFLVPGRHDLSPVRLGSNPYISEGSKIYGQGFVFDDNDTAANPTRVLDDLLTDYPNVRERILPFIGGDEVNSHYDQSAIRSVIFLSDLKEEQELIAWEPLVNIVRARVYPERMRLRDTSSGRQLKKKWWAYQAHRPKLYALGSSLQSVLVTSLVSAHFAFVFVPSGAVYSHKLGVIPTEKRAIFACVQSRLHEVWTRFLSAPAGEGVTYSPTDCFATFPLPQDLAAHASLEAAGEAYHSFRAIIMIERKEGLTKTYNRFHDHADQSPDIVHLRALHAAMDAAVLRAYGWDELAERAAPEFVEQAADEGKTPKTRLDWRQEFRDEVLACLLALNAERAVTERTAGFTAGPDDEGEEADEGAIA